MNEHLDSYEKARENFVCENPAAFNFAGDVIDRWAEDPEKRAIQWLDERGNNRRRMLQNKSRLARGVNMSLTGRRSRRHTCCKKSGD